MDMKLIVVRLFFIMVLCGSVGNWEQGKKQDMDCIILKVCLAYGV